MHAVVYFKKALKQKRNLVLVGLQICCFFAAIVSSTSLRAQTNILETELNFWFAGAKSSGETQKLNAGALVSFNVEKPTHRVGFLAKGLSVQSIERVESPLKSKLIIRPKGDSLIIRSSQLLIAGKVYRWLVKYQIDLGLSSYSNYVINTDNLIAFNSFNVNRSGGHGNAGMFFPSLRRDDFVLKLNLSVTKGKSISTNGRLSFVVDISKTREAQFWNGTQAAKASDFYLVIGSLEEEDEEEIEQELLLADITLRKVKIAQSKEWLYPTLEFYDLDPTHLSDSEYVLVDSLSNIGYAPFFVSAEELGTDTASYALEQALLLYLLDGDTVKASQQQWEKYNEKRSAQWQETVLGEKWKRWEQLPLWQKPRVLDFRLQQWVINNENLFGAMDIAQLDTVLFQPMKQSLQFPTVHFSYRYVGGDTAMYVHYNQDTSHAPVYWLPAQVKLYSSDGEIFFHTLVLKEAKGKIKVPYPNAPSYADVNFGSDFMGNFTQTKPDVYNLFLLNNGEQAHERKAALQALILTQNVNLKSTILDIALSDSDEEIVLMALANTEGLNIFGITKLEAILKQLSKQSTTPQIKEKAQKLVLKYYQ